MPTPRLTKNKLWDSLCRLYQEKGEFYSAVRGNRYTIPTLDRIARTYTIKYKSGNTKVIPFDDIYALYQELYRIGRIPRGFLNSASDCMRLFNHKTYLHAPGATLYAILPELDSAIFIEKGGHLCVDQKP
jgi:hypothetical protein